MKQKQIEYKGKTVSAAVDKGLKALGLDRDEVEVDVIDTGSRGFLGLFGGRPARVALEPQGGALPAQVRAMAGEVLRLMGLPDAQIAAKENGNGEVHLSIESGEHNGLLIGRGGETLRAFEHVMSRMAQRQTEGGRSLRVVVNVGGYRTGGSDDDDAPEGKGGGRGGGRGGRNRRRRRRGRPKKS